MDTDVQATRRRRGYRLIAIVAAVMSVSAAFTLGVTSAGASSSSTNTSIEGVWSFNGGQIAVQPEGNGKFEGVVVQPTTFATCTHPAGQKIWKEMTLKVDGSYWGFHQWYKTESCVENPVLGPSAWRVITQANGSRYLRVCLSSPGTGQPTIPSGSAGVGASYGCESSTLTAPLASSNVGAFKDVVSLPDAKKCLSARRFAIHIRNPRYDPFKTVKVTLQGKKVGTALHGQTYLAEINLRGLPRGAFTVRIKGTTFRGNHLSGSRTYHTCVKRKTPKKSKHRS
jgi:hypothetical protein